MVWVFLRQKRNGWIIELSLCCDAPPVGGIVGYSETGIEFGFCDSCYEQTEFYIEMEEI